MGVLQAVVGRCPAAGPCWGPAREKKSQRRVAAVTLFPGLEQTGDMGKMRGLAGGSGQGRTPSGHKRCMHGREERNCKECGGFVRLGPACFLLSLLLLLLLLLLPGQPPSSRTFLQIIQAILLHLLQRFERSSPALPILSGV